MKALKLGAMTGFLLATIYSILFLLIGGNFQFAYLFLLPIAFFIGIAPATAMGAITAGFIGLLVGLVRIQDPENCHPWLRLIVALFPGLAITSLVLYFRMVNRSFDGLYGFLPWLIYGGATIWMGWKLRNL